MSEVHEYYLVNSDELESIKNPPFINYNDAYQAIVKSKEEVQQEEPKLHIKRWKKW
jgi:hypothetical protein